VPAKLQSSRLNRHQDLPRSRRRRVCREERGTPTKPPATRGASSMSLPRQIASRLRSHWPARFHWIAITLIACSRREPPYVPMPDVSSVTLRFATCDSGWSPGYCIGKSHAASPETFTIVISRQLVLRRRLKGFHDCEVDSPTEWFCLDADNHPVALHDGRMLWRELDDAHQFLISQ
jgi:hypothetical protein